MFNLFESIENTFFGKTFTASPVVHSQSDYRVAWELDSSPHKGTLAESSLAADSQGTLAESSWGHLLPSYGLYKYELNTFAGTAGQPRWPESSKHNTFS